MRMDNERSRVLNTRQLRLLTNKKVTLERDIPLLLSCDECRTFWGPDVIMNVFRMSNGYWKCPNGCNTEE